MKYLVFSDIHGSLDSCTFIMNKYNEIRPDKIILLGDILYHGPRNDLPFNYNPKEVIKNLNSIAEKIICVKGNCDAEVDQMVLNFKIHNFKILTINNKRILLTHGHHINYNTPTKDYTIDIVMHGHTHINQINTLNSTTYINLGSITIPKDNIKSYAIIDNNIITIYNINNEVINKFPL